MLDLPHDEDTDMTVPSEVPAWLLEGPTLDEPFGCSCADCDVAPAVAEPVRWAVPGVWRDEPALTALPPVGAEVALVRNAVAALAALTPSTDGALALAEAQALQGAVQQLRVLLLPRVADVADRKLFSLAGFHGVAGWQRAVAPDAVAADRVLAGRLGDLPCLAAAVSAGRVSLAGAREVSGSLRQVRGSLDRPDGLVDGQDGEALVTAVVDNTITLGAEARGGLAEDSPALQGLCDQVALIHLAGGSQTGRVEAAFTLLAEHVTDVRRLRAALEQQVFAILPNLLEEQQAAAERKRGLALSRNDDGSWALEGRLTPECGELLHTALAAEARRDPANPVDTLARQHARDEALRAEGKDPFVAAGDLPAWEREALAGLDFRPDRDAVALVPRSRSRRVHDALARLLARYLGAGLGGVHDKVPVQITATVPAALLEGRPGALPGKAGTGGALARSLLRRWWTDAHVTTLILQRGWIPIGQAHTGRTLSRVERQALLTRWSNRCAGADCCSGQRDPLIDLVPHHVLRHAETGHTSLEESLPVCPRLHQDLHLGKKAVRLRDGRLVTEDGYLTSA
jgi:hypothetical protein